MRIRPARSAAVILLILLGALAAGAELVKRSDEDSSKDPAAKEGAADCECDGDDKEKIETAVEPLFQQHFVEAMAIPHKTADFVNLSNVVTLPEKSAAPAASEEGAGGRRRGGGRRRRA